MDFLRSKEQEQYRSQVCQFLRTELTPQVVRENRDPTDHTGFKEEWINGFRKRMGEHRYLAVGLPPEYGGPGKDMVHQVLFYEEMQHHGAPPPGSAYTDLWPAIILFGTEEQKREFLPRILKGEISMFLGYSEPEAGSDLANLQCRAVLEGDDFVINGQKLFSSGANRADYGWMAVRTDPEAPKHRGISLLILDMKSPGISFDWYKTMSGWWHHGVHFDNVRVPRSMLVGELNRGWYHLMAALDFERASNGNPGHVTRLFDELLTSCKETRHNGRALIEEPTVRNTLADLAADVRTSQLVAYSVASMHTHGEQPQHETAMVTLVMRETARKITVAHMEILGAYAQLTPGSRWAPLEGRVEWEYRDAMFFHFAAGGFDITRNVIARRGLGLPRD